MLTISKFEVLGLFGHLNHTIELDEVAPTILAGPNGSGKTHILLLIKATLEFDVRQLLRLPFTKLVLTSSDGLAVSMLRASPKEGTDGELEITSTRNGKPVGKVVRISGARVEADQEPVPERFRQTRPGRWFDRVTGRSISEEGLKKEFGFSANLDTSSYLTGQEEYQLLVKTIHPVLIDTKRLDVEVIEAATRDMRQSVSRSGQPKSGIARYIDDIRREVTEARRASVQATQRADLSFAARALEAATLRVKEQHLHERYDRVVSQYEELAKNSLATGEAPLGFPPTATPTVRRILSVFLDDWEKRLEPLQPVNLKLKTLRSILDSKLSLSGKSTSIDELGVLRFRTSDGRRIPVSRLSSGEQHLVALFTRLTFSTRPGSIVLIDEPEISMHAAWKHAFLDDINAVAKVADFQTLTATHSTAIINGQWDLVRELGFSLTAPQSAHLGDLVMAEVDDLDDEDDA